MSEDKSQKVADEEISRWMSIAPGLYVRRSDYESRKYFDARKEASLRYMQELKKYLDKQRRENRNK